MIDPVLLLVAAGAVPTSPAAVRDVHYAAPAAWIAPAPDAPAAPAVGDAALRILYSDNQERISANGTEEIYTASRLRILKPEALAVGNMTIAWQPDSGSFTVHQLRLIRDGKETDILATTKFRVLQREERLEQSMLDGNLTATIQIPGLQVGDEIAFAATITRHDPAFGTHAANVFQLPLLGMQGVFRVRVAWPAGKAMVWRPSPDLKPSGEQTAAGERVVTFELRDPSGAVPTEGAPPRYNVRRLIELSDFRNWSDVSRLLAPAFDRAAALAPDSPLRAEVARIAAASPDRTVRTEMALRLVESAIRYVYVGLDGANYMPAAADDTWRRRFGDCKAKTALLIALLRELGIPAEPVLVNSRGGDGLDERLPSPRLFDHVVVRAVIGERPVLLDGTRFGDQHLDTLPPTPFRWGLPVTAAGSALVQFPPERLNAPLLIGIVDIDARAGTDRDARISARNILRGDEAIGLQLKIAALAKDDADRQLKSYWRQIMDWVEPTEVWWSFDERHAALTLGVKGEGKPDWKGDQKDGRTLTLIGAGLYPPDRHTRPRDQDQKASWAIDFPRFRCWATTVRLPSAGTGWSWHFYAEPMNRQIGGVAYWRASGLRDGMVRTVMSTRAIGPEISAAQATEANGEIAGFNNDMSSVFEANAASSDKQTRSSTLPFADDADWVKDPSTCFAPGLR